MVFCCTCLKNTLEKKLSCICEQAGIEGTITNHSLRATSATHMYMSGVPEKVIQECTGHRSPCIPTVNNMKLHQTFLCLVATMLMKVVRWHTDILRLCTPQCLLHHRSLVITCNLLQYLLELCMGALLTSVEAFQPSSHPILPLILLSLT